MTLQGTSLIGHQALNGDRAAIQAVDPSTGGHLDPF